MLKKAIISIINHIPPRKIIVFESAPDFSDNTKSVFDEMIKRGINKHNRMYWLRFDEKNNYQKTKNVKYINANKLWASYIVKRSKCVISCNRFIASSNKKSFNIYLCHGNPLKNTKQYFIVPDNIQRILVSSDGMKQIMESFYGYDANRLCPLGYPRNDVLTNCHIDLHSLFSINYNKIIVWYPTVRQFKSGIETGSEHALPLIWNEEIAKEVNDYAKRAKVLIVLKPHFAQDVSKIKKLDLSNLFFIDDSFFAENKISSYEFVAGCDALLTDFSSIYYDYTLCDKPIGLIWEDYEEYNNNPGFAVDMEYTMKGGVKIYTIEELKQFISDIACGIDLLKKERREIRDFSNYSFDGKNTERVVDYIIKEAKIDC